MRKVIVSNMVSLDGYIAGPGGAFDWHSADKDFFDYAEEMLNAAGTLLFGRITYQMMAAYWPTASAKADDPIIAGKMNSLAKIVFSKTLDSVDWENSTLVKDDIKETVLKLKNEPGKDIVILGSGSIVSLFTQMGIIDEYRMIVNPVILGGGIPEFSGISSRKILELTDLKRFSSGMVMLYYQPKH